MRRILLVVFMLVGCGGPVIGPTVTPVVCNQAGSPYLDPEIPDECEFDEPSQP